MFYIYDLVTDIFVIVALVLFYYQWNESFNLYIERRFIECLEGPKREDICEDENGYTEITIENKEPKQFTKVDPMNISSYAKAS